MVLVEAPILAGRVACASSDLVQVAGTLILCKWPV